MTSATVPSFGSLVSSAVRSAIRQTLEQDLPVTLMAAHAFHGVPLQKEQLAARMIDALEGRYWKVRFTKHGLEIDSGPSVTPLSEPTDQA